MTELGTGDPGVLASEARSPRAIYGCIAAVSADLAKIGIGKDGVNTQQGYRFRGIDAVYNALAPLLAKHSMVILPRIIERAVTERQTAKGGILFSVVVVAEFDFIATSDGSRHVVRTYGEAMDSADKATNKAMSAAYKYAAFQAFCIPTEGDNDADATTHADVLPAVPEGYADWFSEFALAADEGLDALRAAWNQSSTVYRGYLTKHHAQQWNDLKTHAAKVVTA